MYPNISKYGIVYVTDSEEVKYNVEQYLEPLKVVGCDTETTSLDPHTGKLRLLQIAGREYQFVFDVWKIGDVGRQILREYLMKRGRWKIFHNAKFDVKFLRAGLDCEDMDELICTKEMSKLLAFGNENQRHSLADTTERYLSVTLDKSEQRSDWSAEHLTEKQIIYAGTDVRYLLELYKSMLVLMKTNDMMEVFELEMRCVPVTADIEWNGIYLNWDKWTERSDRDEKDCKAVEWQIYSACDAVSGQGSLFGEPNVFNINSQLQLRDRLKKLGIKLPTKKERDGTVKETTGKDQLKEIEHVHPVIPLLIQQKTLHKAYTSYGRNWAHCINPTTGRVHGNLTQIGTMTGRYTTRDDVKKDEMEPPLLGIPRDEKYRVCFEASEGHTLVWADYAAEELRILAELSGEPVLLEAFVQDKDPHLNAAVVTFGKPEEEVTKKERDLAKDLNYGLVYGVGVRRFAQKALIEEAMAEELINRYFSAQPRLKSWLDRAGWQAVKLRHARTMSGRLVKFRFNDSDRGEVSLAQRNGKNTPIQGTGADILKVALRNLWEYTRGLPIRIVLPPHDEIITEVRNDYVEQAKEILVDSMLDAGQRFLKTVPVKVDLKFGPHWKK